MTDGSRIEGSHKGWNSLQRTQPSGVEVLTSLAADHVLRRNIRIDYADANPYPFTTFTYGSHHIDLVDACAQLWNALMQPKGSTKRRAADLVPAPILEPAESLECFGLVKASPDVTAYYTLIKDEPEDPLVDLTADADADRIVASLGLDPALLDKPLRSSAQTTARAAKRTSSSVNPLPPTSIAHPPTTTLVASSSRATIEFAPSSLTEPIDVDALLEPSSSPAPTCFSPAPPVSSPLSMRTVEIINVNDAYREVRRNVRRRRRCRARKRRILSMPIWMPVSSRTSDPGQPSLTRLRPGSLR